MRVYVVLIKKKIILTIRCLYIRLSYKIIMHIFLIYTCLEHILYLWRLCYYITIRNVFVAYYNIIARRLENENRSRLLFSLFIFGISRPIGVIPCDELIFSTLRRDETCGSFAIFHAYWFVDKQNVRGYFRKAQLVPGAGSSIFTRVIVLWFMGDQKRVEEKGKEEEGFFTPLFRPFWFAYWINHHKLQLFVTRAFLPQFYSRSILSNIISYYGLNCSFHSHIVSYFHKSSCGILIYVVLLK